MSTLEQDLEGLKASIKSLESKVELVHDEQMKLKSRNESLHFAIARLKVEVSTRFEVVDVRLDEIQEHLITFDGIQGQLVTLKATVDAMPRIIIEAIIKNINKKE